jgi:hypothetical protein
VYSVTEELQQIGALELFRSRQLAERSQHLSRTSHPFTSFAGAGTAPYLPPFADHVPVNRQNSITYVIKRQIQLGPVFLSNDDVLIVRDSDNLDSDAALKWHCTNPCLSPDEPPPVFRQPKWSLEARRGDLQHVARTDHRPGFQETFEGPADHRTIVGRNSLAGSAVRTIHPHLQDGALQRSGAAQIDELEAEPGNVVAKRSEERVG